MTDLQLFKFLAVVDDITTTKKLEKGKPVERRGRKASGLNPAILPDTAAGLPSDVST